MGGAADVPQRSSSPLKRRASDLEDSDVPSSQKDDVDMVPVPPSDPPEPTNYTESTTTSQRAQSVDMLKDVGTESANDPVVQTDNMEVEQEQSTAPPVADPQNETPSVDVQIKTVTTLCEAAMQHTPQEDDMMYIVSTRWLQRVLDRGSEARQKSKVEPEGEVGPVDNSDIIQDIIEDSDGTDFVRLKHGSGLESFALFPQEAWDLIMLWYKLMPGALPIQRFAHNTNPDKNGLPNTQYELHPPVFTIHRLYADNNTILVPQMLKASNPPPLVYVLSRSTRYYDFLKKIKEQSQIDLSKKVRVWRVPRLLPAAEPVAPTANTVTPPSSRPSSPAPNSTTQSRQPQDSWKHLLLQVSTFLELEKGSRRELVNEERGDITLQKNYNGSSDLSMTSLGDSQHIVLDEAVDSSNFVSNYTSKSGKATSTALTRTGMSQSQPNSGRNSPAPSGPMTRGRTQKSGKVHGTVGLSNLGNTCYMNSALQCVRSVEELTKYFLSGAAANELNYDNPLGNHGQVAEAYARLLTEIYKEPVPTSVTPRNFKNVIGKYAPSFSGYGQQDSQEFLGFLLDGLQEDLSRVKKKPYIEKPDSTDEMVNNPEAIREMAAKVWDITKKRDDSVIADLFTGMYKSTLVCPVCSKVSITFDPFNNLTLQLPIENAWRHTVLFFPLNERPHQIHVDMDKQGSILALKEFISKRVDIPVERLFAAEEFKGKFYKIYDNYAVASEEIQNNDVIAMYELEAKPTNWPPVHKPKKKSMVLSYGHNDSDEEDVPGWQDPAAEKMLVPVFHRRPNPERAKWRKPWLLSDFPHFIVVTPEEARSEDVLKRKILEKVATFSSHSIFRDDDEASDSAADSVDPDIVLTTGSDADSSGDSKVVATSIDGEDGLVDVTMKESNGVPDSKKNAARSSKPAEQEKSSFPLKRFNNRRPKFLAPGSFLEPELQNLFTLGYFSTSNELIPTGWNPVDEDKTYPTLSSRMPEPREMRDGSLDSYEDGRTGSDSDEGDSFGRRSGGFSEQTRMNDESSEEDELAAAPTVARALPVRPAAPKHGVRVGFNKRRPRNIKTYSKKGNQPRKFHELNAAFEQDTPDEGPLIRLGEGIIVDWDEHAYAELYDGDNREDETRGCNLVRAMPTLEDPLLDAKRKTREQRRRNGITLDDCLNEFGKEEILSEADTWYCPRCKEHRRASKKFELWKTPDVLVMHLKRFSSSGWRRDKLDVMVDFPIDGLDLSSRVVETQEGKQEIYDLFAVDDHWGGLGGGHYTAFAKNYTDGEWYEYNDSSVSKTKDPSRVVTQSAYLLFYRRRSEVPLDGPKIQQIVQDFDNPPESGEDDITESGEEQGPVGSTFRGSSGPLTGVGAAHHRPNPGSASTDRMTVNPSALENLPAYEAHEKNDEDAAPLLVSDAVMNDGLQESIEDEDEGVDMGDTGFNYSNIGYDNLNQQGPASYLNPSWDWGNLPGNSRGDQIVSGTGSDMDDAASDVVQNNSSASEGSIQGRMDDFNNAIPDEDFVDQSPVPDIDEAAQLGAMDLHRDLLESHVKNDFPPTNFDFRADEADEFEEPATEIHVEEGEGLEPTSKTA